MIHTMTQEKRLDILFMTRRFPPSVGGMEKFAYDLSRAIGQKSNVHLIKWGGSNKYVPVVLMPLFFIRACWVLTTQKIEVIHMQDGVFSVMGVVLKYVFRKPLTVVIHGLDITHENKLYQILVLWALKRADIIFCISHMAQAEVVKRGINQGKTIFIPLGITDDLSDSNREAARQRVIKKLELLESSKIILSAGRLVKRKGVNWFVGNVLPGIVKNNSKVVFIVSGQGPEQEAIKHTIKKLELEENVHLLGRTSDEFLADLYKGSDVFVMPNIKVPGDMEGFGIVLLEAALCELPIVATGIEGITDAIIKDENGILVAEKDVTGFANVIVKLLSDSKKAHQMGAKSRQYTLKNFSWDKIADQYIKGYNKLLN